MHSPNTTATLGQLHAILPGPNGTHACLTLYDACPHTSCSTFPPVRCKTPCPHHNLPPLPLAPPPQNIEYINNNNKRGRNIIKTTRATLSPLSDPRHPQGIKCIHDERSRVSNTSCSTSSPQEAAMTGVPAHRVLSERSSMILQVREPTAAPFVRSTLKTPPSVPTVYLLSFSADRTPTTRAFVALLNQHLPPHITLQYTIDARSFLVPPTRICENYSGITGIVQDEVLRDVRVRQEVGHAVDELTQFVRAGGRETGVAVYCTAGTHRSVAIAELIARGVSGEVRRLGSKEGVKVVVRHVHRVRGSRDPY
ncbi:hypothetical protein SVAN01_01935 [Stagonosporopsis vannaccii]|nr:hypothetical protein SVAN01_01935 [Stagonosporopsis vannaccii]